MLALLMGIANLIPSLRWLRTYSREWLRPDVTAGLTTAAVVVPKAMAFATIAQLPLHVGLYTAIVAGGLIPLLGGSRVQVSGPTAAFVVILAPISHRFGVGGLVLATLMAGALLLAMGAMRLGRFIEFVPYPVTTGFTAGIAVVILHPGAVLTDMTGGGQGAIDPDASARGLLQRIDELELQATGRFLHENGTVLPW